MEPLTPEQVENWRKILRGMVGPYASILSAEEINSLRDSLQQIADRSETVTAPPGAEKEDEG